LCWVVSKVASKNGAETAKTSEDWQQKPALMQNPIGDDYG